MLQAQQKGYASGAEGERRRGYSGATIKKVPRPLTELGCLKRTGLLEVLS